MYKLQASRRSKIAAILCVAFLATAAASIAAQTTPAPANASAPSIVYVNQQYGFSLRLPASWKGYTIIQNTWEGDWEGNAGHGHSEHDPFHGPKIVIRHPLWTKDNPREDIPIEIFTVPIWQQVDNGDIITSAAPFGPGELGRNKQYVFALPPRFSFDELEGVEEVRQITEKDPLTAF
jgi:hypothetical protein